MICNYQAIGKIVEIVAKCYANSKDFLVETYEARYHEGINKI